MEVGKLVTSETCGSIFYFVIDETHPDEPQPDSSRCYYVVAPALSSFSYREAYCVLCRALCGLENRTYLHRWHSLHEQIFGTTPYVQFVDAVRASPLTQPNSFRHVSASPPLDGHPHATVTLPALFLDETTARLALRKAESEHATNVEADTAQQQRLRALHQHNGPQQGCSTPVQIAPTSAATRAPAAAEHDAGGGKQRISAATQSGALPDVEPEKKLSALLELASQWQATTTASPRVDDHHTVSQLQHDLQEERQRRREAEEKVLQQTQALAEAHTKPLQKRQSNADAADTRSAAAESAAKEETSALRRRVQELEARWADAQAHHAAELERTLTEKTNLQQQLWQQSQAQGVQLRTFLDDNAGAVKRVEAALEKREKDVCAVYTTALEERDVRIAQLSQEVLSLMHSTRQLAVTRSDQAQSQAERVAHLEEMTSQLKEWNATLRGQLSDAALEIRELRQRVQDEKRQRAEASHVQASTSPPPSSSPLQCSVCAGLPYAAAVQLATQLRQTKEQLELAQADTQRKSEELHRAALVIEQLTRGVRHAKTDADAVRSRQASILVDPLLNSALAQTIR